MRDADALNDLKREYMSLVRKHGQEVTEFQAFKQSLLELNRKHRREAANMYATMISKVERRVRRCPA